MRAPHIDAMRSNDREKSSSVTGFTVSGPRGMSRATRSKSPQRDIQPVERQVRDAIRQGSIKDQSDAFSSAEVRDQESGVSHPREPLRKNHGS